MNTITILLVAALSMLAGCSQSETTGDGTIQTESRSIADFSAINVSGAYQIKWVAGNPSMTITADQNLLPLITTSVEGNTLQISGKMKLKATKGISMTIASSALADVHLSGPTELVINNLSVTDLKIESSGVSSLNVDGSVNNLDANLSGESKLNAKSLQTKNAKLSISGMSIADISATDALDATVSGASTLTYSGNPKSIEQKVSGLGKIQPAP